MHVRYLAEYDGAVRVWLHREDVRDEAESYRHARVLLDEHPQSHRVEVYDGPRYLTRATRGYAP